MCTTKCNYCKSGNMCKTKCNFSIWIVEINFSPQVLKKLKYKKQSKRKI